MPYYYKRKRKKINKRAIRLHLIIVLVCLPIGASLWFVTEKGPSIVQEQIETAIIEEAEKSLGKKLDHAAVERVKKAYHERRIDASDIERVKRGLIRER